MTKQKEEGYGYLLSRIKSMEEIMNMLIKGMEKQNATIGAFEARINSIEQRVKKLEEKKIEIIH